MTNKESESDANDDFSAWKVIKESRPIIEVNYPGNSKPNYTNFIESLGGNKIALCGDNSVFGFELEDSHLN